MLNLHHGVDVHDAFRIQLADNSKSKAVYSALFVAPTAANDFIAFYSESSFSLTYLACAHFEGGSLRCVESMEAEDWWSKHLSSFGLTPECFLVEIMNLMLSVEGAHLFN